MAFNYVNAGSSGRYSYHMPLQLIQHMDFSVMQVPSNTELSNLINTNISHCSPLTQQMPPADVQLNSIGTCAKVVISDFTSTATSLCMPSVAESLSTQDVRENYSQSFQHSALSQTLSNSCQSDQNINKVSSVSGVLCYSNQQINNITRTSERLTCLSKNQKLKPKNGRRDKEKKYKRVRSIKQGCSLGCNKRCKQKLSQNTREDLFNEFWNLSDDCKRRDFISHHAVKMAMMSCKEGSRRRFSVDWAFTVQGESFSVCKLFFLDTLDISEEMAYSVIKESTFCGSDNSTTKSKQARMKKLVWRETDVDDYSERIATKCSKDMSRYESKKEKITEMRPGCIDSCRRNCQAKFTYEEKLFIFNSYYNLANVRKQREFIMKHMRRLERKNVKSDKVTRRGCSIEWILPVKGKSVPVCKTFFLHTVGISEHSAYSIGLQNEIQPVEKHRIPRREQHSSWSVRRKKYLSELIVKGRLKSAFKVNRKNVIRNYACSNLSNDNERESSKARCHESDGLKLLPMDKNLSGMIMSPDISMTDTYSQHTESPHSCLSETNDIRGRYSHSSADMHINLRSLAFSQQMQSNFENITNNTYMTLHPLHTNYGSLHQQCNQRSPNFNIGSGLQSSHGNLLMQTLNNTAGDDLYYQVLKNSQSLLK